LRGFGAILLILNKCEYVSRPMDLTGCLPLDTDNEDQLLLSWDVEGTILLRQPGKTDLLALLITILLDVFFGTLEDNTTLLLLSLFSRAISYEANLKLRHTDGIVHDNSDPKDG